MSGGYKITYTITAHDPPLSEDEVLSMGADVGACDAFIIHSLIYPEDGSFSHLIVSRGSTGEELAPAEIWKCWSLMAHSLMQDEKLSPGKRELCRQVHELVKRAVSGKPVRA